MPKEHSIVKVDKRPYTTIARENWGLTKQQMKGMHVHHRIPRSKGGTNDPSNLYVCSPSFHRHMWHNGEEFIEWASVGGKSKTFEQQSRAGQIGGKLQSREAKQKNGLNAVLMGTGIHSPDYRNSAKYIEDKRKGAQAIPIEAKLRGLRQVNSQKWMSTVDGFISTAGGVANHNRSRGYPADAKVLLSVSSPIAPC